MRLVDDPVDVVEDPPSLLTAVLRPARGDATARLSQLTRRLSGVYLWATAGSLVFFAVVLWLSATPDRPDGLVPLACLLAGVVADNDARFTAVHDDRALEQDRVRRDRGERG